VFLFRTALNSFLSKWVNCLRISNGLSMVEFDSVKMHHVFRLVSHVLYCYFTMFCHCYVLFCMCFGYLLIMEHMHARSGKGSEMVKKSAKMQHSGAW
jgi:hypothetical protein